MNEDKIWVLVRGGLGNQMFQAAYATALAQRFGVTPQLIDFSAAARLVRRWELDCFGIQPYPSSKARIVGLACGVLASRKLHRLGLPTWPRVLVEQDEISDPPNLTRAPRVLSGYWQGECYFKLAEGQVRSLFRFPEIPAKLALPRPNGVPVVAIHVRQGDYVDDQISREKHLVCGFNYYRNAWDMLHQKIGSCSALVFSDDPLGVRRSLRLDGDVHYVDSEPQADAWIDMARMSQCDHFIISNSSYSWWAAYLGASPHKQVIAPRFWFRDRETAALKVCPDSWWLL